VLKHPCIPHHTCSDMKGFVRQHPEAGLPSSVGFPATMDICCCPLVRVPGTQPRERVILFWRKICLLPALASRYRHGRKMLELRESDQSGTGEGGGRERRTYCGGIGAAPLRPAL
jgi:hypothetical protein